MLTIHRQDFQRLHRTVPTHPGINVCTENREVAAFAGRIDAAIREASTCTNRLIKIVRGNPAMTGVGACPKTNGQLIFEL